MASRSGKAKLSSRIALRLTEGERDQLDQLVDLLTSESSFDVGLNDAIRHALKRLYDHYGIVNRLKRD